MKTVINNKKEITVDEIVTQLQNGANIIVFYMSQSASENDSYPVFLRKSSSGRAYGFAPPIVNYTHTFQADTLRESIQLAICSGKKLLVLERNEVNQLFKKII